MCAFAHEQLVYAWLLVLSPQGLVLPYGDALELIQKQSFEYVSVRNTAFRTVVDSVFIFLCFPTKEYHAIYL